jgi:hypothetical protein
MRLRENLRRGDRGATLLLVLIIVSFVSLVMSVILALADTSVRSTIQLRDQASDDYGADAATQAVLNGLKTSGINCSNPNNPTPFTLGSVSSPFYSPLATEQGAINASAKCTPDAVTGTSASTSQPPPITSTTLVTPAPVTSTGTSLGGGDPTLPAYAILTTGSASGDFGVDISSSANNKVVCVENGSVGSNKDINASGETLAVRLAGSGSASDCTTGTGADATTGSKVIVTSSGQCLGGSGAYKPTACTAGVVAIPTPDAPGVPTPAVTDNPAPTCTTSGSKTYAAFVPGRYTSTSQLNSPCGKTGTVFEWFSPGTYYFDYSGSWNWPSTLVAGAPIKSNGASVTPLDPTNASTLTNLSTTAAGPNACADPAGVGTVSGVEMVFGGSSTVTAGLGTTSQICASSPAASPPVAIWGLASNITVNKSGGGTVSVPAETMCSASGCGTNTLISTTADNNSAQAQIYVKGFVYAPNAQLIMSLKNSPGQVFNWGIVIRNFRLSVNGSSPNQPFVQLPKPNTGVGVKITTSTPAPVPSATTIIPPATTVTYYTIRYINVWICTVASLQQSGATSCPSTGTPNVQARVLTDTNGAPVKVLSWNHI